MNLRLPKSRKGRVILAVAASLLIVGTVAAAFLARAPIAGQLRVGAFQPDWSSATVDATNTTAATCEPTVSSGTLNLSMTGFPGDTCAITGSIALRALPNTPNGKIVGFHIQSLPTDWEARLTQGCGSNLVGTDNTSVRMVFTIPETVAADGSTANIAGSAVLAQPQSQAPATPTCPAQIGE